MTHLVPCAGCARHVRASEPSCPFCGAACASVAPAPRVPTQRLGRAARFAFGAAVVTTLNVAGCGESHTPEDDAGAGRDAGRDGAVITEAGVEVDAGHEVDAGEHVDAGMDAGNIAPPYGAPAEDAGGSVPLYGGPPAD